MTILVKKQKRHSLGESMLNINSNLLERIGTIHDLQKTYQILSWDKNTHMPLKGLNTRIRQMGTLKKLEYQIFTSEDTKKLLEQELQNLDTFPIASPEYDFLKILKRKADDINCLNEDFIMRVNDISGNAHEAWVKARKNKNFKEYEPFLEKIIELSLEECELRGYEDDPYTTLLHKYELDIDTQEVKTVFDALKPELIDLLTKIKNSKENVNDNLLHQQYEIEKEKEFAYYISKAIGFDYDKGALGTVVHPFCTSFGRNDIRINTRWDPEFLCTSIFGTLHEAGHGIYEQNIDETFEGTFLDLPTSLGVHESQSRLFENVIGRRLDFWGAHFNTLKNIFPSQLKNAEASDFHKAINTVKPSFIRVEADEVTYNLHIILRFELEQDMLHKRIKAKDLPEAWREKMENLLGISPPNDAQGCLQDVHWTRPGFSYFPTYTLGNLYSVSFFDKACSDNPSILEELKQGRTDSLRSWLRKNIHQHGSRLTPKELLKSLGLKLNHKEFMNYVTKKYSNIYNL